jgi:tetratricopeptide (TPR) repeat protein
MADEESTQPIDIEGLRAELASRPDAARPGVDDAQTETSIPIAAVVDLDTIEPAIEAVAAPPRDPEPEPIEPEMIEPEAYEPGPEAEAERPPPSELPAFAIDEDQSPMSEDLDATRMGRMDDSFVRQAFAAAPHSDAMPSYEHRPFSHDEPPPQSEDLDATRMRKMDDANIRQAFAAAEARETTAVFHGPVPEEAHPSIIQRAPPDLLEQRAIEQRASEQRALESGSTSNVIEVDSAELESVPEMGELDAPEGATTEIAAVRRPASVDVDLSPSVETETRMRQSSVSIEFTTDEGTRAETDGGETAVSVRSPSASTNAQWQPPAAADRAVVPYHTVDAEKEERELDEDRRWGALVDLYRARMPSAETPAERAQLLHRIASVEEHGNNDEQKAFNVLLEAFELDPKSDALAESIDRVGRSCGRIGEIAERAKRQLQAAGNDNALRIALLTHLVFWYERCLSRGSEAKPFISELERLDQTHPVVLRKAAQLASMQGDSKTQRELLTRALDRIKRREEKVAIHLTLASAFAGTAEAAKHYEAAVSYDPNSIVALQGLERLGREKEKHAQVEWSLERQSRVAQTGAERTDALVKLAELYETKFLKRERAASILEKVIEDEPTHPQGLKMLERCYHALRDWPNLARILRARADVTYDKKQKVELLELAAEVYESKIGDAAAAVEIHRDLLVVDPQHRRALGDLARLYEKLGDWPNVATYKARLAELAPSKRATSQQLVALGDFLSQPGRDEMSARLQYERAVNVDPTNAAGWEALQRIAAAAGDDRRVVQCMENRAKHESPRQRAVVYVELANYYLSQGDERAARDAFENAVRADASNESAAIAMLDAYTREERWADAAPLCELLVNVAIRDKDKDALFTRMRLATRIAAALGDAERAMSSALTALEAQPDDPGAQADLVAVCTQCTDRPALIARAKEHLARVATGPTVLPADMLVRLASLQKDSGDLDAAEATLERALETSDDDPDALAALADVLFEKGDYARTCKIKIELARNATSAEEKYKLFVETGEIWARHAKELDRAASVFEEARKIKPLDSWLLHTLMWVYSELQDWEHLSSVLEGITQIQESPDRKVKSLIAMAQVVENKVGDLRRAAELYDQVLDIDRKKLDAFQELVRILTAAKDWETLDRAYRKMLARIKDDDEPKLKFLLFHQLGLIYRDRLGDAQRAFEALEAAQTINPGDTEVRKILTELLVVTDNVDKAVARVRNSIARDPQDPELYAELYDLFLRQHAFDKAWCAINVLASMRALDEEQAQFHEDYAPVALSDIPGQLIETAWQSHLLHGELDPTLTRIFGIITPAVARMRHALLRPEMRVGRPFTPSHSRMYEMIRATFTNGAEILSLPIPELLLGDAKSAVPFAPALSPLGAIHVNAAQAEARADNIVYVVGKRLAEQRVELLPRAFFPSVPELTALLAAAVRVSRQEGAKDTAGAALDASLSDVLTQEERTHLRAVITQALMEGALLDVKRWSQVADLSSMRAGLLLCGDVEQARRAVNAEPQSPSDLTPREKIGELYKFATSDLYSDLRGAIGVSVST